MSESSLYDNSDEKKDLSQIGRNLSMKLKESLELMGLMILEKEERKKNI